MANFTQLNLQNAPRQKPMEGVGHPQSLRGKFGSSAVVAGSFLVTTLVTLALLSSDERSKPSNVSKASLPVTVQGVAGSNVPSWPAPVNTVIVKPAAKKAAPHRRTVSMYSDPEYGVSFLYPRQYAVNKDHGVDSENVFLAMAPMNFVRSSGTTLVTLELPSNAYPETDFSTAFFRVSVDRTLSAPECMQFASSPAAGQSKTGPSGPMSVAASGSKLKLGGREFLEIEDFVGGSADLDIKYFHTYENGTCYEFALGLATLGEAEEATPVDRSDVFSKLEKVLGSVRFKSAEVSVAKLKTDGDAPASGPSVSPIAERPTLGKVMPSSVPGVAPQN